ncbi:hypothetical protein [Acinetobacter sp. AHP123]|uniref:hypothetical protein n=1 Tax=Acinetobacter sp. AHP123 TaxID=2913495 RepID=UPI0020752AFB|nr:hypothetical protein [Acinetobacter sp. AHP123]
MKNIAYENKGILNPSNKVKFFGINLFVLQVIFGIVREKRVLEFIWGTYCFIRYKAKKSKNYVRNLDEVRTSKFIILEISGEKIVSRSWVLNEDFKIYVEYGLPGARIVFKNNGIMKIYDPYKDDHGVYHIHNIIHLYDDKFLVSTGDSSKYLDEFVINENECKVIKRYLKHLGGFTASIDMNGCILMGTDFSCRPNYIFNFTSREKYFLPKEAWLEYIIDIERIDLNFIEVFTKRLNEKLGHKLLFSIASKSFVSVTKITIKEEFLHETL